MDINRLCPGCMREVDDGIQKMRIREEVPQSIGSGEAQEQKKCPHCGFCADTYKQNARCLPINTILAGKYLVGAVLGEGGFGITYIGYDLNMQTRIAIKEYFPVELVSRDTTSMTGDRVISLSGDKSATYKQGLKKYVAEAQNVSQFSEIPGVVSVKDFFYENETAYIVMEYIDGISLKDYLKERGGRLSEEESLAIMKPVLEALVKVHEAGIVHRDISPDNIMLTFGESGNVPSSAKLIDFGAARMTAKNDQKSLTIILKHGYAPEEQYRTHGEQGPWTDVYAVCAVLYRMLTGQTPVPAMDRIFQDGLKSFDNLNTKASRNTQTAILKGLAVKKEDRIQSMTELLQALYEGKRIHGHKNTQLLVIAAAIGGVIIIGTAAFGISLVGRRAGTLQNESPVPAEGVTASESQNTPAESKPAGLPKEGTPADLPTDSISMDTEILEMESEEEEIGEKIVEPNPQTSFAGSNGHAVIRLDDGTVASAGSNQYGQRNLSEWSRIAAVAAGDTFTAGLREDGKVLVAGELTGKEDVERWEGILAITGCGNNLYGLTAEGTVVANRIYDSNKACIEWTGVKAFAAGSGTGRISALTQDGQVFTASNGLYTAAEISGWEDVRYLVRNQDNVYGICEDGSIVQSLIWSDYPYDTPSNEEWKEFQDIVQVYAFYGGIYAVDAGGGLHVCVNRDQNQEVSGWKDLAGVTGMVREDSQMMGLQKDGRILKSSRNYGNAEMTDMTNLKKVMQVKSCHNDQEAIVGITQDDRILYYTLTNHSQMQEFSFVKDVYLLDWWDTENSSHNACAYLDTQGNLWMQQEDEGYSLQIADSDIRQIIYVYLADGDYIAGLHDDGTIAFYQSGVYEVPDGLLLAEEWTGVVEIAGCGVRNGRYVLLGLMEDGSVKAAHSDGKAVDAIDGWTDIASVYSGNYAAGAIMADGTPIFLEDAPEYNYGQYNTYGWTDLTQLAMGLYHTAGLREDGTVCAVGRNDAGQCDVEDWTDIVYITATDCATLGIRSDGTLVIAGEVGW